MNERAHALFQMLRITAHHMVETSIEKDKI